MHRALLAHRREVIEGPGKLDRALLHFARQMRAADRRLAGFGVRGRRFEAISGEVRRCYRRARRAYHTAFQTGRADDFHRWRKAVKTTGYLHRIFRQAWPPMMRVLRHSWDDLSDLLGKEHDLTLLCDYLKMRIEKDLDRDSSQAVKQIAEKSRQKARAEAKRAGALLLDQKPQIWLRRLEGRWNLACAAVPN